LQDAHGEEPAILISVLKLTQRKFPLDADRYKERLKEIQTGAQCGTR
jgi:hypothetical protein